MIMDNNNKLKFTPIEDITSDNAKLFNELCEARMALSDARYLLKRIRAAYSLSPSYSEAIDKVIAGKRL